MHDNLVSEALRLAPTPGLHVTFLPTLSIVRSDAIYESVHSIHKPSLCFIAQGTKVVTVGEETLRFESGQFVYSSIDLPISGEVIQATQKKPYLVLILEIEPKMVFDLVVASGNTINARHDSTRRGIFVDSDEAVTEAFFRLLRCQHGRVEAQVLAPAIVREIVFRLLCGRYGDAVRDIGLPDSHTQRIARVIEHLKRNFRKPQSVPDLAQIATLSTSAFHAHFRKVTKLTPVQYLKHLRLQEARRILLTSANSAANTAFQVGYQSVSQFSREYARYFGLPPINHMKRASHAREPAPDKKQRTALEE